ncbi:TonB family protein [Flammeovirga yaeyamensis]|uniref:TonB family protein n=1 Tax=Flammeovirga yaeyamensis TaxID=367791 RepID=A0AAX1N690_9BACT|nr:energy transducer TonB [Flammeovirga yaeyamensis]MBB3697529.1 TonB family protein [Flammeovirga yaeyamensis]NMF36223.1 energy transducer TonB [Flammeovirga yaeyamensis]QWG02952.1 TonB family protein [Flammeovirga yaeyamensis]
MKSLMISLCLLFGTALISNAQDTADNSEKVFTVVDEEASFPGGMRKFYQIMGENMKYPEEAKEAKQEGKVYVQFTVLTDGSLNDFKVVRGIGHGCDEEAVRLFKTSPKWRPAKKDGKPVNHRMFLPLTFKL